MKNLKKWILFCVIFLLISGCGGSSEQKMSLADYEDAEKVNALLLAFNESDKYYSYGFPSGKIFKDGYVNVDTIEFQTIDEVKEYYYTVCTENFCEKWKMFTGETPRWKEMDGILYQSMADGMWVPITDKQLEESTLSYGEGNRLLVQVPFKSDVDNSTYYMEYTIVETNDGMWIDGAKELTE